MSSPSDQAIPARVGPYRVEQVLGRGGMGVVYIATAPDGQRVAVKTLTDENPLRLEGFRREAHILGKLRHPGVVRLIGGGDDNGVPYYAMELLAGASLADVLEDARARAGGAREGAREADTEATLDAPTAAAPTEHEALGVAFARTHSVDSIARDFLPGEDSDAPALSGPLPARATTTPRARARAVVAARLPRLLTLFHGVCQTLAYIHGEGVIHCDLKPANIVVTDQDTPVLIDFGLMRRFAGALGRETLEVDHTAAGTLLYMAPEQLRGDDVDARTDLYALGCMLFQAVCGRAPFEERDPSLIALQHLGASPPRPSSLVADLPPALEDLLLRLLAKDPDKRPSYAEEVSAVLEALGARPDPRLLHPEPAPYVNRPPFAGHDALLEAILSRVRGARGGDGKCILLVGPSGSGKTRLAAEAAKGAQREGFLTLAGECEPLTTGPGGDPSARAAPLRPLRALLRHAAHLCRLGGPSATRALLGPSCRLLDRYEPTIAGVPGYDEYPAPAPLPALGERERIQQALADLVRRVSEIEPLLLGIDDVQWADDLTLATLVALGQASPEPLRATLLLTCRSESPREELEDLQSGERAEVVRLGPLAAESLYAITEGMLAQRDVPPELTGFLIEQSGGSPFFIAEYLRYAIASRLLRREEGRWALASSALRELRAQGSVDELLTRRLSALSPNARRLAGAAAVLGRAWELLEAGAVAGLSGPLLYAALDDLVVQQVLVSVGGGTRYRFLHDRLREATYAGLAEGELRALHARAAEVIAEGPEGLDQARRLAHHYTAAGVLDKAFHYTCVIGEHALSRGAYKEAGEHLASALRLLDLLEGEQGGAAGGGRAGQHVAPLVKARLLRSYAEALYALGQCEAMGKALLQASRLPGLCPIPEAPLGWIRFCLRAAAGTHLRGARSPLLGDHVAFPRDMESLAELCSILGLLEQYYRHQDRMVDVVMVDVLCALLGERGGEAATFADALSRLSIMTAGVGLSRLGDRWFDASLRAARRAADPLAVGVVLRNQGFSHTMRAEWGRARSCLEEALRVLVPTGFAHETEEILVALSGALRMSGRLDEAERMSVELVASAASLGHDRHHLWGLWNKSLSELARGDFDAALRSARAALVTAQRSSDQVNLVNTQAILAGIHHYNGAHKEARELADEALSRVRDPSAANVTLYHVHAFLPPVYAEAWRRDRASPSLARLARATSKAAGRAAWFVPMAAPMGERHKARLSALEGKEREARRLYRRSAAATARLQMPFEEALAYWELGALAEAGECFARMGSDFHVTALRPEEHTLFRRHR